MRLKGLENELRVVRLVRISFLAGCIGMRIAVKNNAEIMRTLGRFGMKKFAGAVMYVLKTVFAMPSAYMICEPDEKRGRFLLNEIIQTGNFGQFDERIKRPRRSGDRSSVGERTVWGQVPGCAKERQFGE